MKRAELIFLALALLFLGFGAYQGFTQRNLGGTVTYTQTSDTIGTFLTNVSSSLTSINTHLNTISSTVGAYGNLTGYNVPLHATGGGTGTTTAPSSFLQFLGYNGTGAAWLSLVAGSGMTVTSSTTSTVLSTTGLDETLARTWSGTHNFSSSVYFQSTTYVTNVGSFNVSGTTIFDGAVTFNAGVTSNSSTFPGGLLFSSSTSILEQSTTTKNFLVYTIPANTLGSSNVVSIKFPMVGTKALSNPCTGCSASFNVNVGGTNLGTTTIDGTNIGVQAMVGSMELNIIANGTSAQIVTLNGILSYNSASGATSTVLSVVGTTALSQGSTITVTVAGVSHPNQSLSTTSSYATWLR